MNWKPPIENTLNSIETTIKHPNENKLVIEHEKYYTPNYGDKYKTWQRKEVVVQKGNEVVRSVKTESYIAHKDEWEERDNYSHNFELANDNITIPHSGKEWKTHFIHQSNKCANIRWKNTRENKPKSRTAKEIVTEKIQSEM